MPIKIIAKVRAFLQHEVLRNREELRVGKSKFYLKVAAVIYLGIKLTASNTLVHAQSGTLISTFNPPAAGYEFQSVVAGYSVKSLQVIPGTGADFASGGDLLVGGSFITSTGSRRNIIGLLQATGLEATVFNTARGVDPQPNGSVKAIINHTLLGAVVFGGDFTDYYTNAGTDLNLDGIAVADYDATTTLASPSSLFLPPSGFNVTTAGGTAGNTVKAIAEFTLTDFTNPRRFFVGGKFSTFKGITRNNVALLDSDGTLNPSTSFNPNANGEVNAIVVLSVAPNTDYVLFAGAFSNFAGSPRNHMALMSPTAAPNYYPNANLQAFNPTQVTGGTMITAMAAQADGKIVIAGDFTAPYNGIARLNADGTTDGTFNPGTGPAGTINAIAIAPSTQKIVIGGSFTSFNGAAHTNNLAVLTTTGSVDTGFSNNAGTGPNAQVNALAIDSNGDLFIGGDFTSYDATAVNYVAKINASTVLPIELLWFKQKEVNPLGITLAWETASELNNDYFTVERSADGETFTMMGKIAGAGTSNIPHLYQMVDGHPAKGKNYYRLKQTDHEGGVSFSTAIQVDFAYDSPLSIFPNPTNDHLTIEYDGEYFFSLTDIMGREILPNTPIKSSTTSIDLTPYEKGIYILQIHLQDGVVTQRISHH